MSWKDDRPSIAALLKESWSVFFPRAPKLAACFLPFAVLAGVAVFLFISWTPVFDNDQSSELLPLIGRIYGLIFFIWVPLNTGLAAVSWATTEYMDGRDPTFKEIVLRPLSTLRHLSLASTWLGLWAFLSFSNLAATEFILGQLDAKNLGLVLALLLIPLSYIHGFFNLFRMRVLWTVAIVAKVSPLSVFRRSNELSKGSSIYVVLVLFVQAIFLVLPSLLISLIDDSSIGPLLGVVLGFSSLALVGLCWTFTGVIEGVLYHHLRRLKEARA